MHVPGDPKVVLLRPSQRPLDERSDDELMQLASAGADEAFAALVRRHERSVRAYCARLCGCAAAGDDVAQDAFVELWRRRAAYEPRGKFRAFLFTIAHSRCLNAVRRHEDERDLPVEISAGPTELDALLRAERIRRLEKKLRCLPQKLQQALALRFAAGLDYDEMAELLGRSQATVRSRVLRGVRRLQSLLRKDVEE